MQDPNWEPKLQNVIQNVEQETDNEHSHFEEEENNQEEWMIVSNFHNTTANLSDTITGFDNNLQDWQLQSDNYTQQQISEMPNWINAQRDAFQEQEQLIQDEDIDLFSDEQRLAYDIITHANKVKPKEPLRLIINGVAGTGKCYLINGAYNDLKDKCIVTATKGKASYNINGVTIHSLLRLPITPASQKDLSGQALSIIQQRLLHIDYLLIDEYSMLGQKTMGWIDRRCRQATGLQKILFGGMSVILIGDPAQLPPVGDKPLYHSKPSTTTGEQGYCAYQMFVHVVILSVNQRVTGFDHDQKQHKMTGNSC